MNYSNPRISIGIPVYNGEKFIRKCIESVLQQTHRNFELIISDMLQRIQHQKFVKSVYVRIIELLL